jgi:hypothetical protein
MVVLGLALVLELAPVVQHRKQTPATLPISILLLSGFSSL